jgi:hypothetical protein
VPRPFHYDELLARIRAVLRRTSPSLRDRVEAGPIAVDLVTRRATVHGRALTMPAKEYDLLATAPLLGVGRDATVGDGGPVEDPGVLRVRAVGTPLADL